MGSRSKARKRAVDLLYEADQRAVDPVTLLSDRMGATETPIHEYTERLIEGVGQDRQRIDELLSQHAEGWTLERMPAVDRAVLRLGVCELLHGDDVPSPVVIDEAVELVKALSTDDSPRFVNGVLGRLAGVVKHLSSAPHTAESATEAATSASGGVGADADAAADVDAADVDTSGTAGGSVDGPASADDGVEENTSTGPDDERAGEDAPAGSESARRTAGSTSAESTADPDAQDPDRAHSPVE